MQNNAAMLFEPFVSIFRAYVRIETLVKIVCSSSSRLRFGRLKPSAGRMMILRQRWRGRLRILRRRLVTFRVKISGRLLFVAVLPLGILHS
jgi:hypothetical protein